MIGEQLDIIGGSPDLGRNVCGCARKGARIRSFSSRERLGHVVGGLANHLREALAGSAFPSHVQRSQSLAGAAVKADFSMRC